MRKDGGCDGVQYVDICSVFVRIWGVEMFNICKAFVQTWGVALSNICKDFVQAQGVAVIGKVYNRGYGFGMLNNGGRHNDIQHNA
jgi:hypothetical protein